MLIAKVFGIVQGVGFRPFVSRLAVEFNIVGSVANKGSYVEAFAQGTPEQIQRYIETIKKRPPERSVILGIDTAELSEEEAPQFADFKIIESEKELGDIFGHFLRLNGVTDKFNVLRIWILWEIVCVVLSREVNG